MPLTPKACTESLFAFVKKFIGDLELDDRQLSAGEFMVIAPGDELLAFGRVRQYDGFAEICSVGVHPQQRGKGLGVRITEALSSQITVPAYVVTVIPQFFAALGFAECFDYPPEIAEKLAYCTSSLPVEERYCVMTKR
jgi:N-acetylglutamate synthase-like GNAT family acetyltransferase